MADTDNKETPGIQTGSKHEKRSRDANKKTPVNRRQPNSCMTEKMDTDNRQDAAKVDRWFDRQLNQLYSDVISEPLPKEFIELIDKLREKTTK